MIIRILSKKKNALHRARLPMQGFDEGEKECDLPSRGWFRLEHSRMTSGLRSPSCFSRGAGTLMPSVQRIPIIT